MKTKVTNQLSIEVPKGSYIDEGEGVVSFPNGLTITDSSVQRNGTRYDIDTLDISRYGGQLTGDHEDKLSSLIGETIGTVKRDGRVVVNKIRYAIKENPYARLAYDLLVGGFSKNFSIETIGLPPDHEGIYRNAELVGLSQVVTQNNYNASLNKLVHNSLEKAKQDGLNVDGIESKMLNHVEDEHNMEETETKATETETPVEPVETAKPAESVEEAPAVEESNADVEQKEANEAPAEDAPVEETPAEEEDSVETNTESEDEVEEEETPVETAEEDETNNKEETMEKEDKNVETPQVDQNALADALKSALAPVMAELAAVKAEAQNAFDKSAQEPEFKKSEEAEEPAKNDYKSMDFRDRYQAQVTAAWNAVKLNDVNSWQTLREINSVNLEALKEKGIARNSMTLDDLGNFVIAPEMHDEIVGHRNDYSALLNATDWKETLSLEFAWLQRVGDIDMQNVAMGDDGADGNLKPISEYSAVPKKSELEELAAVTVVATSATRFAAVDLLSDAAAGYRNDYDRKRAQLVIAKLEQAVDSTGNSVAYAPASDTEALTAWLQAVTEVSDVSLTGTLIFNARTFAELKSRALSAGVQGPLSEILTTGDIPTIFGYRFIVVPNDLMPTLGGSDSIAHYVDGTAVTINHAVYFADLSVFTGRTSGGLQYDVSSHASYETGGATKSAYQRNELVLRGSFFRGGAVVDASRVAGIRQATAS